MGKDESLEKAKIADNREEVLEKVKLVVDDEAGDEKLESPYRLKGAQLDYADEAKLEQLVLVLKTRFEEKPNFSEEGKEILKKELKGLTWEEVEKRLKAFPEKLNSLLKMEETGGEPNVVKVDEETGEVIFYDCSKESPIWGRNCVYDRKAEKRYLKKNPNRKYNGNAVDLNIRRGVGLLDEQEYRFLQTLGEFDKETLSWIRTPFDTRKRGFALYGCRAGDVVYVSENFPHFHGGIRGVRGVLRV